MDTVVTDLCVLLRHLLNATDVGQQLADALEFLYDEFVEDIGWEEFCCVAAETVRDDRQKWALVAVGLRDLRKHHAGAATAAVEPGQSDDDDL
eukprot:jgi/Chrzof1/9341/UNPLg00312.t1